MKTLFPSNESIERKWYLVDGKDQVLGRMASQIASVLRGKHKPGFSPHLDLGDHVVVINADRIRVTGRKLDQKTYTRYTGYPGGLRKVNLNQMLQKKPERAVKLAVRGMLPKNRIGRQMIRKLRVYTGPEHPHQAQKVESLPNHLRKV